MDNRAQNKEGRKAFFFEKKKQKTFIPRCFTRVGLAETVELRRT